MKTRYLSHIFVSILLLVLSASANAQMSVRGEVVEVLDGKTVVISIPTGKIKAELQFINVPWAGHPLYDTVTGHLRNLTLGKVVDYRARMIAKDRTIGQMTLNGVDVSQQMLRDGAAWHNAAGSSGQDTTEGDLYASTETEAKNEKLGVWSDEIQNSAGSAQPVKRATANQTKPTYISSSASETTAKAALKLTKKGKWGDKNPNLGEIGALANGYNAESKTGYLSTTFLPVTDPTASAASAYRTELDFTYFYKEGEPGGRKGVYVVTIVSTSTDWRFLTSNDLYMWNDGKSRLIGKAKRVTQKSSEGVQETLTYTVNRTAIDSIVNGNGVLLKVGGYLCHPTPGLQMLLYNLMQVSK